MIGGILTQVGDYLPTISSALKNGRQATKPPAKAPDAQGR
jgi:hypothetical protein